MLRVIKINWLKRAMYELYDAENKMIDKGKYVVVWKPVNGEWKLFRDIFNSDMPAAASQIITP